MTPVLLRAYLALGVMAAPVFAAHLRRRARRGKEDPERLGERRGLASAPRPEETLVWAHAASVGEAAAADLLIRALAEARPGWRFLLTTGTRASAEAVRRRSPPATIHQFAPLDVAPWVRRFLDHWRPRLAFRVDSELWPAAVLETTGRGAPLALVNARISESSARGWARAPGAAQALMERFDAILAQDAENATRFLALGAAPGRVTVAGPLKAAAPPLGADPAELATLREALAGRPLWVAASTHPTDEALALEAQAALLARRPELLLILAPRHPARGAEVAEAAAARGLPARRRAEGEAPGPEPIYVADTLGELGLWYRLAPFAFIGGSTADEGGHNPWEAAALGAGVAHGPDVANFAEPYAALAAAEAAWAIRDAAGLAAAVEQAVAPEGGPTEAAKARAAAARRALAPDTAPLERAVAALLALAGDR